jgi:hypothetical protein
MAAPVSYLAASNLHAPVTDLLLLVEYQRVVIVNV